MSEVQALDVPDRTDLLEKLKSYRSSTVEIEYTDGRKVQNYTFIIDGKISDPRYLIGGSPDNRIRRIVDVLGKTGDTVLFENPYCDEPIAVQYAKLFGKEYGEEYARIDIDANELALTGIKDRKFDIERSLYWIENGADYAVPRKRGQFQINAIQIMRQSRSFYDIRNAVKIMVKLDENVSPEEIKKDFESDGEEFSYDTMQIVSHFSKRGPEFYREVKNSNPEWLQRVESQNAYLEREFSDDGKQ